MISPHTSYPPLEMAACDGLVVTNTFETKTASLLAGISSRIVGVDPDPEALAAALADATRAVVAGTAPPATPLGLPATWDEAFRDVVPWLAKAVRELSGPA
jgi:hypothetical protein